YVVLGSHRRGHWFDPSIAHRVAGGPEVRGLRARRLRDAGVMDWCRYHFRSVWPVDAAPERVYAVLERAEEYPRWWPQVREVARVAEHVGVVRLRSVLPYELRVTAREARRDPAARILKITMTG